MTRSMHEVWRRVLEHEGETFRQLRGATFTYKVSGESSGQSLRLSRTNQNLTRAQIEKALELVPLDGPGQINHLRAPSYIYAILMDDRIRGNDW